MSTHFKVSRSLIVDMILIVNISKFFKVKVLSRYDIWRSTLGYLTNDSFCVMVCKSETLLSVLLEVSCVLHFSVQAEDILEHTNVKCYCVHTCNL